MSAKDDPRTHFVNSAIDSAQQREGEPNIGQHERAGLLERAVKEWQGAKRERTSMTEDFMAEAREGEFDAFDTRFYALEGAFQAVFERSINESEEG